MPTSEAQKRARSKHYLRDRYGDDEGIKRWKLKWKGNLGRFKDDDEGALPEPDAPMGFDPGELKPLGRTGGERSPKRKKPSKHEVTLVIGAGVHYGNMGLAWFYPPWAEDALNDAEVGMLSKALATEVLDSPTLLAWAAKAQRASKHGELIKACVLIALPRMAKHGMLPSGLNGNADQAGNPEVGPTEPNSTDYTVPVESRPAHGSDRDDGVGQVSPHSAIAGLSPLFHSPQEQSRFGEVPGSQDGEVSGSHEGSAQQPAGTTASL